MTIIDTSQARKSILERLSKQQKTMQTEPPCEHKHTTGCHIDYPIDTFVQSCKTNDAQITILDDYQQIPQAVADYYPGHHHARIWKELEDLDWQLTVQTGSADKDDVIGITTVDAAIASTGTLLLCSTLQRPLSVCALAQTHIAVVRKTQICKRLEDVTDLIRLKTHESAQCVFISGPSRTADIEQTIVLGAHGPLAVHVLLI